LRGQVVLQEKGVIFHNTTESSYRMMDWWITCFRPMRTTA